MKNFLRLNPQDVRWLLKEKYHWSEAQILEWFDTRFLLGSQAFSTTDHQDQQLSLDLERLAQGEPVAYVIGNIQFLNTQINLEHQPLIPRPETEYWVEKILKEYQKRSQDRPLEILDLCCGSGCIGIAVLKNLPQVQLSFLDIDSEALAQTTQNLELNQLHNLSSKVIHADASVWLASGEAADFDLILANPPYVDPTGEWPAELGFEPKGALFAQKNGLALIYQILELAPKRLKKAGELVIEFGIGQEIEIEAHAKKLGLNQLSFGSDQFGVTRYVRIQNER